MVSVVNSKANITNDVESVNTDINSLYNLYIRGMIDKIRSPVNTASTIDSFKQIAGFTSFSTLEDFEKMKRFNQFFEGVEESPNRFIESRQHAFLRAMGFPTASSTRFYSPGFEPGRHPFFDINKSTVNAEVLVDDALIALQTNRELDPHTRRRIFAKRNTVSSTYAILTRFPGPLLHIQEDGQPFDADKQKIEIKSRRGGFVEYQFYTEQDISLSGDEEDNIFSPRHILKPFVVNPAIAISCPAESWVAVPFLPTEQSRKYDPDKPALPTPGIEAIIELRLRGEQDPALVGDLETLFATSNSTTEEQLEEFASGTKPSSSIERRIITKNIRIIKGLVEKLNDRVITLNKIVADIQLQPLPSIEGPEFGGEFIRAQSEYDTQIADQTLKSLLQKATQASVAQSAFNGYDTSINVDKLVKNLEVAQASQGELGIQSLKEIEIITGEISGLGLIDVLAMYTAFFMIDIDTLLSFIDINAINRIKTYRPALQTGDFFNHFNARSASAAAYTPETFLTVYERSVVEILKFADRHREFIKKNPVGKDAGSVKGT